MTSVGNFSLLAVLMVATAAAAADQPTCSNAKTSAQRAFVADAADVLLSNWVPSMNSTLPSPNLYPHQWSWDASFVAMGYSHFDTRKAIDETEALFRAQWRNGAVPHIVFNPSAVESYFPGPQFWRIDTAEDRGPVDASSSGIVQPPVHALASLAIYQNAPASMKSAAMEHLHFIYPKLVAWHDYLYNDRDPNNEGLVFIRHMWESGMDNSPAWDPALEAMNPQPHEIPPYQRVDKKKVAHSNERPTNFFYDRAVYLIKLFYDNNYDEAAIAEKSPFLIQDVLFNSILARAGTALADIADVLGKSDEADAHRRRSDWTAGAISSKLYDPQDRYYYDYDLVLQKLIKTRISGGLVAAFGAKMSDEHVQAIVDALYGDDFLRSDLSAWTIPSVSRDDPGYTNTTYWKGPAWINVNYLVRDGLLRNARGNQDALRIADFLRDRSVELMTMSGFYEYFNSISGSPHGGHRFSWSAALAIDWVCKPDGGYDKAHQRPLTEYLRFAVTLVALITAAVVAVVMRTATAQQPRAEATVAREAAMTASPAEAVRPRTELSKPKSLRDSRPHPQQRPPAVPTVRARRTTAARRTQ